MYVSVYARVIKLLRECVYVSLRIPTKWLGFCNISLYVYVLITVGDKALLYITFSGVKVTFW